MGVGQLDSPAGIAQQLAPRRYITNLMYMIWQSRNDLQHAFDLDTADGQEGFCQWYEVSVLREYGIAPQVSHSSKPTTEFQATNPPSWFRKAPLHTRLMRLESTVGRCGRCLPLPLRKYGKAIWFRLLAVTARMAGWRNAKQSNYTNTSSLEPSSDDIAAAPGANLVGYAHAELGMGEHVRMSAAAFATTDVQFGVVNFSVGVASRQQATLDHGQLIGMNVYRINLFHINADQMLRAYCHLGRDFFSNRYNIGYWAWELGKCPEEWVPVIGMVDEIWAPSRFIQRAFAEKTEKPVEYMPLCVSLPMFSRRERVHFGLPADAFLFLFTFDFFSYIDRKNPFASILAFKSAFPDRSARVGLVIKVMHGDPKRDDWRRMLEMIDGDPRIYILNQTLSRGDVLALVDVCDCFVSLHRSEGFGRGPAEAMYIGKPVIVTNYSGNTDFTHPDNSCLVDYHLIPVESGQYVFGDGQVWADADVQHAAWYMKKLVADAAYAKEIGDRGRNYIVRNFGPATIGTIYKKRLEAIRLI